MVLEEDQPHRVIIFQSFTQYGMSGASACLSVCTGVFGGNAVDWLTRALYTVDLLELEGLHAEAADVAERLMPLAEGAEDTGR
jgi:hypothetical protein